MQDILFIETALNIVEFNAVAQRMLHARARYLSFSALVLRQDLRMYADRMVILCQVMDHLAQGGAIAVGFKSGHSTLCNCSVAIIRKATVMLGDKLEVR
jgi:hypothetical protein